MGGLIWDSILALEMLFITERIVYGVFASSFILTYIVVLMYNRILVDNRNNNKWTKLFVLATSSALGASLTTFYFDHIATWIKLYL